VLIVDLRFTRKVGVDRRPKSRENRNSASSGSKQRREYQNHKRRHALRPLRGGNAEQTDLSCGVEAEAEQEAQRIHVPAFGNDAKQRSKQPRKQAFPDHKHIEAGHKRGGDGGQPWPAGLRLGTHLLRGLPRRGPANAGPRSRGCMPSRRSITRKKSSGMRSIAASSANKCSNSNHTGKPD